MASVQNVLMLTIFYKIKQMHLSYFLFTHTSRVLTAVVFWCLNPNNNGGIYYEHAYK
jgi:hypothetical protein